MRDTRENAGTMASGKRAAALGLGAGLALLAAVTGASAQSDRDYQRTYGSQNQQIQQQLQDTQQRQMQQQQFNTFREQQNRQQLRPPPPPIPPAPAYRR